MVIVGKLTEGRVDRPGTACSMACKRGSGFCTKHAYDWLYWGVIRGAVTLPARWKEF
jgi:hypothetical protein